MPKLSPPSDGATSAFTESSSAVSSLAQEAEDVDAVERERRAGGGRSPTARGRRRRREAARRSRGGRRARRAAGRAAPSRLVAADERDAMLARRPGWASAGMTTPFGTISYSPGNQREAESRACSETAIRWSIRRSPRPGLPRRIQPRSPEAWNVGGDRGVPGEREVARHGIGVIGSCRWSTSNCSRSSTRLMRKNARGLRMMFGSEPFAGTITERPIGITWSGGLPCRPSRGCRNAREAPRRVASHDESRVDPLLAQGRRLRLGVLHDGAPERPRVRDDDPHLHPCAGYASLATFLTCDYSVTYSRSGRAWLPTIPASRRSPTRLAAARVRTRLLEGPAGR